MLHKKTSSANSLRQQSSRRHDIRNLRAKVRSLLPPDTCIKQKKYTFKNTQKQSLSFHSILRSKFKDFEKLSYKQIEQINESKYYFLGSQESIAYYDLYIKNNYPHLKSPWISPEPLAVPLSFPQAYFSQNLTKKQSANMIRTTNRSSCQSANLLRKQDNGQPYKRYRSSLGSRERAEGCSNRRQAYQQELKVKQQIGLVYLQRQQQLALEKKNDFLKQKMEQSKINKKQIREGNVNNYSDIQFQTTQLATKLRKICLRRTQQNYPSVQVRQ